MFTGSGPGVQTPDGCSVELYARLPYMGDLEPVRLFLKAGASVLELGCGTGRLTRKLVEWGLSVTAVDESVEMLAEVSGYAQAVPSSIESLNLGRRFDRVLLASCLINHPVQQTRDAFISSAARHMKSEAEGTLLIERHDPEWLRAVKIGRIGQANEMTIYLDSVARRGSFVEMALRYESEEGTWTHSFSVEMLAENQIEDLLRNRGIGRVSWHGPANRWAAASLVPNQA